MSVRVTKDWIRRWAERYDYDGGNEELEMRILNELRGKGLPPSHLTKELLMRIVMWKSPRSTGYAGRNDARFVEDATRASFSAETDELRIGALTLMHGVNHRIASAILYFYNPDKYTIMDWRAWDSLKAFGELDGEIRDTFECWREYSDVCRRIARRNGVSLRVLDRALWAYKGGKS